MKGMRNKYYLNLLTRRSAVQAVYQNISTPCDALWNDISQNGHILTETKVDEILLKEIIQKVEKKWNEWDEVILKSLNSDLDLKKISRCAKSILICAMAEIEKRKEIASIIINEYLELTKLFCENEVPLVNKILDNFVHTLSARN
jgi:transcription termination factor NusB